MKTFRVLIVLFSTLFWILITKVICDNTKCKVKLLNDYHSVPDSAFSATSYFKPQQEKKADFSAKAARENYDKENEEFAWCPSNQVEKSLSEYLQIDLGRLTMITVVQTKGRFAQGSGKEFTPLYQIRYSRGNGSDWKNYKKIKDKGFEKILKGPTDAFIDAFEKLDPPIIARIIRIFPYSLISQRVCLKLQLFGCNFTNNLLEYQLPQGTPAIYNNEILKEQTNTYGNLEYFFDNCYDGRIVNDHLAGGLGLLTDTEIGNDFTFKELETLKYIGWYQESHQQKLKSISIKFIFVNRRNFSSFTLYSFSKPSIQVDYFFKIGISFSDDDKIFSKTLEYKDIIHTFNKSDHSINIDINNKTGRFVNVSLYFTSRWLLLSEIKFVSYSLDSNLNENINLQKINEKNKMNTNQSLHVIYRNSKYDTTSKPFDKQVSIEIIYLLTILLCLLLGIITAICSFWIIIRKRRSHRRRSIKKQAMALCSQASFIPYNHNSKSVQCLPSSLSSRPIYPSFTVDRRNYTTETLRKIPHVPGPTIPPSTSLDQNGFLSKQYLPDTNIYTSIGSSDNDSSLSPEYATTSITNDTALQTNNFDNSPYLPPPIEPIRQQMFNESFMDTSDCPSFYYPHQNTITNIHDPNNLNFWRFNGQSITNKGVNFSSQMSFNDFSKDVIKIDQQITQDNLMNISSIYSDLPRINSHH